MKRYCLAALPAVAAVLAACGGASMQSGGATASPIATAPVTASVPAPAATAPSELSPLPVVNATLRPVPSATAAPAGDTGIDGTVTLGPTCPVQRVDSPCADRPYAARITVWRNGTQVAETTSGSDGRFRLLLPPGVYHVVGESSGAFPRGSAVDATVVLGRLTTVQIRYDTGIR